MRSLDDPCKVSRAGNGQHDICNEPGRRSCRTCGAETTRGSRCFNGHDWAGEPNMRRCRVCLRIEVTLSEAAGW